MRNKWSSAVVVTAVGLALLSWVPASDAREIKPLVDDTGSLTCTGARVGKVIQKGTTKVIVKITHGRPSSTWQVFEVISTGSCRQAGPSSNLGTITTDETGFARKKFTRVRADPVYYALSSGTEVDNYFAGIFTSPFVADGAAAVAGEDAVARGDPTSP